MFNLLHSTGKYGKDLWPARLATAAFDSRILLCLPSADSKETVLQVSLLVPEFVSKPELSATCLRYKNDEQ